MGSDQIDRDPEIVALSRDIYDLTGQIKTLVTEINKASALLVQKVEQADIRREGS